MFRNIRAERARADMANGDMEKVLGISRAAYKSGKRTGKFTVSEAAVLCKSCLPQLIAETKTS